MKLRCGFVTLLLLSPLVPASTDAVEPLDTLVFGDSDSESQHRLQSDASDVIKGGLGEPARRLLPLDPPSWDGGKVAFTMKVDPEKPTYLTIKLWGGDSGEERGRLLLFCEGKQVGIRHLGDVDTLDILSDEPRFPGRFTYITTTLPKAMTKGKPRVSLEIHSLGRIWPYGDTWEQFQKKLERPSRGIYGVHTHTDPFFVPPIDTKQGRVPVDPSARKEPGPEVLDQLKERVAVEITALLASDKLSQMQMQLLARAYHVKWTPAYQNKQVVEKLVDALDRIFVAYRQNPRLAQSDRETYNPDWFGLGPSGDVIRLLAGPVQPFLNEKIKDGDGVTRRAGWSEMLQVCRDWHRKHRRLYTNQSMINDLYGIYLSNRGVEVIDPSNALSEPEVRRYLYESVGLEPWRDSDKGGEGETEAGGRNWGVGGDYWQLTKKGLTRELGYVGAYGEVLDWVTAIYDATRPTPGDPGDEKIKAQLVRIAQVRGNFRYPLLDGEGNRAMVLETDIGWRDVHYPGDVAYGQRTTWDAGPLQTAAATLDAVLVGYAQQMFDDNQFFAAMKERMKTGGIRVTAGLLETPDEFELLKAQPPSPHRLPMTPGQPDFVFSDEQDGVVALKHGDVILYASLYWRARFAVNFLARVHYLTPTMERDATVWEDAQFDDSGMVYTRDSRVIEAQSTRHERSIHGIEQALTGEVLPIAKIPEGVAFKPGQESVYAGKGTFYTLRYGPYLIGMNATTDRTYELKPPGGITELQELVSGKTLKLNNPLKVGPRSTVVLYLGKTIGS